MTADLSHHVPHALGDPLRPAAGVFARHGLHGLAMAAIAQRVTDATGADPVAFRRAFPTRLDLACAIELNCARTLVRDQVADSMPGTARERMECAVRRHIRHCRHHRTEEKLRRAVLPTLRSLHPARHRELADLRHAYREHLREIVAEGAGQGGFAVDDPGAAADAVLATLESVVNWYDPAHGLSEDELGDVYADLV